MDRRLLSAGCGACWTVTGYLASTRAPTLSRSAHCGCATLIADEYRASTKVGARFLLASVRRASSTGSTTSSRTRPLLLRCRFPESGGRGSPVRPLRSSTRVTCETLVAREAAGADHHRHCSGALRALSAGRCLVLSACVCVRCAMTSGTGSTRRSRNGGVTRSPSVPDACDAPLSVAAKIRRINGSSPGRLTPVRRRRLVDGRNGWRCPSRSSRVCAWGRCASC